MVKKTQKTSLLAYEINLGGLQFTQKVLFAKNMAVMIKSGLTISEALNVSADSMTGKFKKILSRIQASVDAGTTFSQSLREFPNVFPPLFVSAVYAGETSGSLEENLEHVAEQMRKEKELTAKVKGAMMYPVVVLIATFCLGLAISFFILPQITPLFEGLNVKLPLTTRGLIWFSRLVQDHGAVLFGGIAVVTGSFIFLSKKSFSRPFTHWFLLHVPVMKPLVKSANIARCCRTLGTLLKSGLVIDEAMKITRDAMGNYYYARALSDISERLESGTALSIHLARYEQLFPKLVTRMVRVGEESGRLEETLYYLASFYEEEVDNSAKNMATAIEPILLIGIGLVVGFLALSIITPIYNITGNIKA